MLYAFKMKIDKENRMHILLLEQFNKRNSIAFSEVYNLFYNELYHFASRLYQDTEIEASDILHDIFINIWISNKIKFNTLNSIKGYIFIAVKNNFKNYITHKKCVDKYKSEIISDDNLFVVEMVESEIYSFVNQAVSLLPSDCAEIIKYHIEGWNAKEISEKMNISERSVYSKKNEAISILKQKIGKDKLLVLMMLIS